MVKSEKKPAPVEKKDDIGARQPERDQASPHYPALPTPAERLEQENEEFEREDEDLFFDAEDGGDY
jgi:hypothetical protein